MARCVLQASATKRRLSQDGTPYAHATSPKPRLLADGTSGSYRQQLRSLRTPHHKVVQVITRAVPGIRETTIRSHLHRLRKRGFVEKVSNDWRLTAKGVHNVDSEVDLDKDNETSKGCTISESL